MALPTVISTLILIAHIILIYVLNLIIVGKYNLYIYIIYLIIIDIVICSLILIQVLYEVRNLISKVRDTEKINNLQKQVEKLPKIK